jgi:hypothetical protein
MKGFAMRLVITLGTALAIAGAAYAAQGAPAGPTPVAIELFTSQGCSSCPPADAIVEQLSKEANTVILTRPVTYWDRLGWRDTLALESNTDLQNAYARRGGEGAGVYTPQAVVQGGAGTVGSRQADLRKLVAAAQRIPGPSVQASLSADGGRSVAIGAAEKVSASVSVIALRSNVVVRIGSGENGGRAVRYTNVVVTETEVGNYTGSAATITVPGRVMRQAGADRYALVVRGGAAGRIVAARYI